MARSIIRTVVTAGDARNSNNGLPNEEDDYKTKLLKWIPAETVAFYAGLVGIPESLRDAYPDWYVPALLVVFLVGLVGTPLLLNRSYYRRRKRLAAKLVQFIMSNRCSDSSSEQEEHAAKTEVGQYHRKPL